MKYICLNLKRFDIPVRRGGTNDIAAIDNWAFYIMNYIKDCLGEYPEEEAEFIIFFPEAHIMSAFSSRGENHRIGLGCQSVSRKDAGINGNFGAMTSLRSAKAMNSLGCNYTIIGHCEERNEYMEILMTSGSDNFDAINILLGQEIKTALDANLKVLYCVGETADQKERWRDVLEKQITEAIPEFDNEKILIAYEPIWAVGPGKIPPGRDVIRERVCYIKSVFPGAKVIYGGGLKQENADEIALVREVDGGLIALTHFEGQIGFYPDEYIKIIETYMKTVRGA